MSRRAGSERGAGAVLALALVGAVVALTVALLPLLAASAASQRAEAAADAAALAAADTLSGLVSGVACDRASEVAQRNGARLHACVIDGAVASVSVSTSFAGLDLTASARAGPAREPAGGSAERAVPPREGAAAGP